MSSFTTQTVECCNSVKSDMIIIIWIVFTICFSHVEGMNTLYQATRNISESSWSFATTSTKYGIKNVLDCAGKCQIRHSVDADCNAFKYDNTSDLCDMGLLTFLEDPGPGESPVAIMVDTGVIDNLDQVCRGGESCCGPELTRLCGEGEGDCQRDEDCEGTLQCGEDNCGQSGGLWDAEDDCCEKRCSSDRPCPQVKCRLGQKQVQIVHITSFPSMSTTWNVCFKLKVGSLLIHHFCGISLPKGYK